MPGPRELAIRFLRSPAFSLFPPSRGGRGEEGAPHQPRSISFHHLASRMYVCMPACARIRVVGLHYKFLVPRAYTLAAAIRKANTDSGISLEIPRGREGSLELSRRLASRNHSRSLCQTILPACPRGFSGMQGGTNVCMYVPRALRVSRRLRTCAYFCYFAKWNVRWRRNEY